MLRAAASAGRIAARGVRIATPRVLPAAATGVRHALKTLAPTTPAALRAGGDVVLSANKDEAAAAALPIGKISQIIGAVVDVQFGTLLCVACVWGEALESYLGERLKSADALDGVELTNGVSLLFGSDPIFLF